MGFAVIPIIFAIAEDAFSNVPRDLVSGSLALGANRWQTVTRVVLPTASPGIFSAIMVGFGRAVGETMIVLMATGNTPILDWNPFNGFRTLSANIAVEIPEAPQAAPSTACSSSPRCCSSSSPSSSTPPPSWCASACASGMHSCSRMRQARGADRRRTDLLGQSFTWLCGGALALQPACWRSACCCSIAVTASASSGRSRWCS